MKMQISKKQRLSRNTKTVLTALTASLLLACATSPKGRKQFIFLPDEQMASMGVQAFQDLKSQQSIDSDPKTNAYVKCVANAITKAIDVGQAPSSWEVVVFKDDSANAFALPGGKIGVHTGLLKVAQNADQLAAVLGHEVGHVLARHGNERVSEQFATQGGLALISATLANKGPKYDLLMSALGVGAQFGLLLPHSRTQESEADIIGLDLMAKAGFDPKQSVELWKNMSKAGGGQPPEFLSTHPSHGTRMDNLNSNMPQALNYYTAASTHPKCTM